MYETTYHRAASVDEATALIAKDSEAKFLAGGHTLLPVMKQRLASPTAVIDIGRIASMIGIEATGDTLTIKAATPYCDILESAAAPRASALRAGPTHAPPRPHARSRARPRPDRSA